MPIPPAYPETYLKRIQIHWSDGVTTGYPPPSSCDPTVNEDGTFDFFRKIATGESKDLHWRRKCAEYLREQAKIEAFPEMDFVLDAFPKNYTLYDHFQRYHDALQERRHTFSMRNIVEIDKSDPKIYDLALFAIKDIPPLEELCFDYSGRNNEDELGFVGNCSNSKYVNLKNKRPCYCGSANCRGWLFG
ncbi:hypothetical protein PCK1_002556 [Pneumocystis canis]|nr:hypothetical protein PCK1_002556 [Pneumocystis canis]